MLVADRHFAAITHLVPSFLWSALQVTGHRLQGRAWHLGLAIALTANALFYASSSLVSGIWRRVLPGRDWLRDAWRAMIMEITAPRESPQRAEYNAVQRLAYIMVFGGAGLMIASGTALWFGRRFPWMLAIFGGERIALIVHVALATSLLLFVLIHLVQVMRAGLPTIVAMIVGRFPQRRAQARGAFALAASVVTALVIALLIVNATSGASGIPGFLQWAVPAHHSAKQAFDNRRPQAPLR